MPALRERFRADGAFERSFARVDLFVTLEIRLIAKAFVARSAIVGSVGASLPFRAAARGFHTPVSATSSGVAVPAARRSRRRGRRSLFRRRLFLDGGSCRCCLGGR